MSTLKRKLQTLLVSLVFLVSIVYMIPTQQVFAQESEQPTITVTTTFLEDLVTNLAGDEYNIQAIMPAGTDPHIYTAQASDLNTITEADLILYHGLNFEAQLAEVLEQYGEAVTRDFNEEDLIYVSEEEVDPHYWFDIELYKQSVDTTRDILTETFPEDEALFQENATAYQNELDELATWVDEEISRLPEQDRILITPHDAFSYFGRAYDFTVYAPQGISTESEVSNQQIEETVNFILENQVPAIFLDTTSNPQGMQKLEEGLAAQDYSVEVIGGEGQELYSDSLAPEGQAADTYIGMFRHNVSLIVDNLAQ